MSTEENKTIIQRCIEAINKQDLAALHTLVAADYVGHITGLPPIQGSEALKYVFAGYYAAFPDFHFTVEDMVAEGDKVVGRGTFRATHKGELMGIPATGKQVAVAGIHIYRVASGKLAEEWIEQDNLGLLQQLGVIPPMG